MRFSIIAISYNQSSHIEALCNSLLLMNYNISDYEVIIVDDGSNPPISSLVSLPSNLNLHIIYLPRCAKSGRARARNAGAALSKGEYFVFIDGDCLVSVNFLTNYEKYFSENSSEKVVSGSFYCIDFYKKPEKLTHDYLLALGLEDRYNKDDFRFYLEKINGKSISNIHMPWLLLISRNFAIKNETFNVIGRFDERFIGWGSEDTEFAYRIVKSGYSFNLLDNKVFHLSESKEVLGVENKYKSWVCNIGLFYEIHRDPAILLLMTQEKLIYDAFFSNRGWDHQFQIKSFQALKSKQNLLEEKHI